MLLNSKKTILHNSLVIVLAALYLFIRLANPGFEDALWPFTVILFLIILILFIIGLIKAFLKILQPLQFKSPDHFFGSFNLLFGLINLIFFIRYHEPMDVFSSLILLTVGFMLLLKTR